MPILSLRTFAAASLLGLAAGTAAGPLLADADRRVQVGDPVEDVEQVGEVDGEVRVAITLDRNLAEVERFPGLAGVPQTDFLAGNLARQRLEALADAELVENARAVGAEPKARADFL